MTSGIQFIPAAIGPDNMQTVRGAVTLLNTRFPETKLTERAGPGGKKLKYVPWDESLRLMNTLFGQIYWGEDNTAESYEPTSRTYRLTKRIWIAVYDPVGQFIVVFSRAGQGRAVARDDSDSSHDLAASAVESDAFSKAVKKLGDAFAAYLYDHADPARQENPTSAQKWQSAARSTSGSTSGASAAAATGQATSTSSGTRKNKPTDKMDYSLKMKGITDHVRANLSFDQARAMLDYWNGTDAPTVDGAMEAAGLFAAVAAPVEDHYLDSRSEEVEEIPF